MRNKSPFIVFVIVVVAVSALLPGAAAAAGTGAAGAAGDQPDQPEVANSALPVYVGVGIAMLPISLAQKVLLALSLPFVGVALIVLLRTRSILNRE
jgi:hypothetical protein